MIYRGYDVEFLRTRASRLRLQNGQWIVVKDGHTVSTCKSEEEAMNWIDAERKKAITNK